MAVIETKYSVGDVVYFASSSTEQKLHPCPDCLGERAWKALSPAGGEYAFACPRCAARYRSRDDLSLAYTAHVPLVTRLTVGSVRFDSGAGSNDTPASYMCVETGVGSGSVYREDRLFETEEAAHRAAQLQADTANASVDWIVERYNRALEISDYQLDSAAIQKAKADASRAGSMLWNLSDLFEKIEAAGDKDEILEAVSDYKTFDWARDRAKVAASVVERPQGRDAERLGAEPASAVPATPGDAQPSPSHPNKES